MGRPVRILFAAAALLLAAAGIARAEERILDFDSRVVIGADGVLTVTETITVRAEGDRIKRGIYRDFPTRYKRPGGGTYSVGLEVVGLRRDGQPENWFTEGMSNGVRIYAGRKDYFLPPGRYRYEITYRTDRQIGFFDSYDELYWNVTGNDWVFPIDRVQATIVLPEGARMVQQSAYTGPQGAEGRDWRSWADDHGNPVFETTRVLDAREGLTVAVAWPKGIVAAPGVADEAANFFRDNLAYFAAGGGSGLLFLYYLIAWMRIGRDPPAGPVIPRWNPPRGISPAAARYVNRMEFDRKALGAAVVSLAVKGHLTVDDLGGSSYILSERTAPVQGKMSPGERAFKNALFKWGSSARVEKGNHKRLKPAVDALQTALSANYEGAHFSQNILVIVLGVIITVLTAMGTGIAGVTSNDENTVFLFPGVIAGGVVMAKLFTWLIKAPTVKGRRLMDEIEGFRMYLATAEQERLNLLHPPEQTPELFEKYLPYAMALDVETEWGDRFKEVLASAATGREGGYSPGWYHGRRWDSHRPGHFANSMGSSLGGAIASAATPPGSSSGSGGGGFSGGGGGGGGGGGW